MIYVSFERGSIELLPRIQALGIRCERARLPAADFAFTGKGPDGDMDVGVERKRLHDMLTCIEDGRYNAQRGRMRQLYGVSILLLEGLWRPHDSKDLLMEGFPQKNGSVTWGYCRPRGQVVPYSKLRRYLFSVSLANVIVTYTRDEDHTAHDIYDLYHYFGKAWRDHVSLLEMQKLSIATLNQKPSLVRKWAADLDDIGTKKSDLAARHFRTPISLATADEVEWLKLPGVGVQTAQRIYRQINGYSRV